MVTFSDVVDATDNLSDDEQETLIEILRRRLAERNRQALVRDVADARAEFESGTLKPGTVNEIMDEANP